MGSAALRSPSTARTKGFTGESGDGGTKRATFSPALRNGRFSLSGEAPAGAELAPALPPLLLLLLLLPAAAAPLAEAPPAPKTRDST